MPKLPVTVVIPTLNEAAQIGDALDALAWADEVIIADGGSNDGTPVVARGRGARVLDVPGKTIAAQRNAAIAAARNAWILALDADERVPDALRTELASVLAAPHAPAYRIRRQNVYLGQARRRGEWSRDWQVRLFPRERRFVEDRVHERLEPVPNPGALRSPMVHVPFRDLAHHVDKVARYARWAAEDLYARGRRAGLLDLCVRPAWRFVRDYLVHGGCLEGRVGFITSVIHAYAGFLKYAFLWELADRTDAA